MMDFLRWLAGDCGRDMPMALVRGSALGMGLAFSIALSVQVLQQAIISGFIYGYLTGCIWVYSIRSAVEEKEKEERAWHERM